ncbi:MAG: hypothetical protein LBS63_02785 [Prevotellaceae bacterium]|jgi:hypothetical protein|nr:hypothetical protein [Prevotellaceae bacterium]
MEAVLEQPTRPPRRATAAERIPGVEYDAGGNPVLYTVEETFHDIGDKLVAHYGETIRAALNESLTQHGLHPLS